MESHYKYCDAAKEERSSSENTRGSSQNYLRNSAGNEFPAWMGNCWLGLLGASASTKNTKALLL